MGRKDVLDEDDSRVGPCGDARPVDSVFLDVAKAIAAHTDLVTSSGPSGPLRS